MILTDYASLVTSEHNKQPKFMAMTANDTAPYTKMQEIIQAIYTNYDLDFAIGSQLDIIGEWVGISRNIEQQIDVWFSWNTTVALGWDSGSWADTIGTSNVVVSLPDEPYRFLIRAKIVANHYDGTLDGMYSILSTLFVGSASVVVEYSDISITIGIIYTTIGSIERAMIREGYIPIIPMGVSVREYITTVTDGTFFSWDTNTSTMTGWDTGQWYITF
jgi:hypothetical protein